MRRLLLLLLTFFALAACSHSGPPSVGGYDWRLTPTAGGHMLWRFRFGNPVTSQITQTVTATAAQVTDAGLEIELDEWGGCKSAKWSGLTGGQTDRTRVRIDIEDSGASGGWRPLFSGSVVQRPTTPNGDREALGDKYLRLKELPLAALGVQPAPTKSGVLNGDTLRGAARGILASGAAADLPHLVADTTALPDGGPAVKRTFNGESVASAMDGIVAFQSGWGWTTLASDQVYVGPPPSASATVVAGTVGTQVALRDVSSEGLRNAIRWVLNLGEGRQVAYESRHASVATLGRSSVTRVVDIRQLPAMVVSTEATYASVYDNADHPLDPASSIPVLLRDGLASTRSYGAALTLKMTLNGDADWIEFAAQLPQGVTINVLQTGGNANSATASGGLQRTVVILPAQGSGGTVTLTQTGGGSSIWPEWQELNPKRLDHAVLDAAAEQLYTIPADHAGSVSVSGLQPAVGSVTVRRPGLLDFTEVVKGTRLLLREPYRTEYVIGEPDASAKDVALSVLIARLDEAATDQAVNTLGSG